MNRLRGWKLKEPLVEQGAGEVQNKLAPAPRDILVALC